MLLHKSICKGGREGGNKKREGEGIEGERERERGRRGEEREERVLFKCFEGFGGAAAGLGGI